jgi:hypothetical protein
VDGGGAVTGVRVVSLKVDAAQSIPADGQYHLLRFPYDASEESYDAWSMHDPLHPDGYAVTNWAQDPRSGLIWPRWPDGVRGWGAVHGLVYWEAGDYTEVRSRVVRDPLGIAGGYDSTCTEDHVATPGGQYRAKNWGLFVSPGTPLGLMVRHNAGSALDVTLAEFKLAIHPVEEPEEGP